MVEEVERAVRATIVVSAAAAAMAAAVGVEENLVALAEAACWSFGLASTLSSETLY